MCPLVLAYALLVQCTEPIQIEHHNQTACFWNGTYLVECETSEQYDTARKSLDELLEEMKV